MSIQEMNESEPLMRCRKADGSCRNPWAGALRGRVWKEPFYCPDGNRHKDGMTCMQAFGRNLRTCRSVVKGEIQVEAP